MMHRAGKYNITLLLFCFGTVSSLLSSVSWVVSMDHGGTNCFHCVSTQKSAVCLAAND